MGLSMSHQDMDIPIHGPKFLVYYVCCADQMELRSRLATTCNVQRWAALGSISERKFTLLHRV